MTLANRHPEYTENAPTWQKLRDFNNLDAVKTKGQIYLPPTDGMVIDGMRQGQRGFKAYQAYKLRAPVPDYIKEGVRALTGLLHQKPATIRLPPQLEYLREKASPSGESLAALHRRIKVEQLIIGRVGLLADISSNGGMPYIALYSGESIVNWNVTTPDFDDPKVDMVILNETGRSFNRTSFSWDEQIRYRIAWLDERGIYRQRVAETEFGSLDEEGNVTPKYIGKTLSDIPFVFINSQDTLPSVSEAPLKALLDLCITIYLGEADYRQNLYMQSQQTLVVIGGVSATSTDAGEDENAVRVGAGARIDVDVTGDAKYIGVSNLGLTEQRTAIENDRKRAETKAGELVQNNTSQAESGKAIGTRYNAQTANLNQLATASAEGLTKILRMMAVWVGADPALVEVIPNTEFIDFSLDGRNFVDIMAARKEGLPISLQSIHGLLGDRGLTTMNFTDEMSAVTAELAEHAETIRLMNPDLDKDPAAGNAASSKSGNVA